MTEFLTYPINKISNTQDIDLLAILVHKNNVLAGWWPEDRCLLECVQLAITEVAEATEGARKDLMDDKLPQFKMEHVELADTIIRILDIGGRLKILHKPLERCTHPQFSYTDSVGKLHLRISQRLCYLAEHVEEFIAGNFECSSDRFIKTRLLADVYSNTIQLIVEIAKLRGYDVWEAVFAKLEFNKSRPDHKPAARARKGGKKF